MLSLKKYKYLRLINEKPCYINSIQILKSHEFNEVIMICS